MRLYTSRPGLAFLFFILMRNAQFSRPLPEERIQAIRSGNIEPIAFDFEKARLAA